MLGCYPSLKNGVSASFTGGAYGQIAKKQSKTLCFAPIAGVILVGIESKCVEKATHMFYE